MFLITTCVACLVMAEPETDPACYEVQSSVQGLYHVSHELLDPEHPEKKYQYKCYLDDHHFLTVIDNDLEFAMRTHPGVDKDGWGTTLYLQAFLASATLKHTKINAVTASSSGIHVQASGKVSRDTDETYGTWQASLDFQYDPTQTPPIVNGSGTYHITIDADLSSQPHDLSICKIASNYLDDVPSLRAAIGDTEDTGDMQSVHAQGYQLDYWWTPPIPERDYPQDQTDWLTIEVLGQLNVVDTAAQGLAAINPVYKPNLSLTLSSWQTAIHMIFGVQYATESSQVFDADNVGVTPVVLRGTPYQHFDFNVAISSTPLPGDGHDADYDRILDDVDACPDTILRVPVDGTGCPPLFVFDFDRDGDVDDPDLAHLVTCFSGPAVLQPDTACEGADSDNDSDVDQSDFGVFQRCYGGQGIPADPACTD